MRGASITIVVCGLMVLSTLLAMPMDVSAEGTFAGGSGTAEDPYQISTAEQLQAMNTDLGAHYVLVNDIDCSGTSSWNSGAGFEPIGDPYAKFYGVLDGDGYTIDQLSIDRPGTEYIGLIGSADSARLENLGLVDYEISGSNYVGGLVGLTIAGRISDSYATGTVSGSIYVGGLAGVNHYYSKISNSYATVDVDGFGYVGGLAGLNQYSSTITTSYATGSASASGCVGGLVGVNYGDSTISNSYSTGSVSGNDKVGGLVGVLYATDTVSNSYSTGSVSGSSYVGGLIGFSYGTVSDSYWDTETSGQSSSAGGTGKTTAEMKQQATFVGWDFVEIWTIQEEVTYPHLRWGYDPADLIDDIEEFIDDIDDLPEGTANSLLSKLDAAVASLETENYGTAINQLNAFINAMEAQAGKKLTQEEADALIAAAQAAIEMIEEEMA